jgi:imidazole glycerol-phosphate synthase subunit HisF
MERLISDGTMALTQRIIPVLLHKGGNLVKGRKFGDARVVGHVRQAVRIYQARGVDELVVLDIAATREGREPDFEMMRDMAGEMFMPCAFGGGIRTVDHFVKALRHGADKVVINTIALERPELITEATKKVGGQSCVISIDCRGRRVFSHSGTKDQGRDAVAWAREVEDRGAGEIIINSIERDGMLEGYDLDLIREVSEAVSVPVVACGGAGNEEHFLQAFHAGAHAVAAGAIWQFTDCTPRQSARYLKDNGVNARLQ